MRARSVGEVLDAAVKLYARNFLQLTKIVAAVIVPIVLINTIVTGVSLPSTAFVLNGTLYTPTGTLGISAAAVITEIVLGVLAALTVQGALSLFLVDAYIGRELKWRTSLQGGFSRIGSLLWLTILYAVLVTLGFVAVILPGIWLITVWCVAVPALMFEKVGGFKALGRSFDLVRGRWWATFAELLVALIMLFIVLFVVGLIFDEIAKGLGVDSIGVWLFIRWLSGAIADVIAFPFLGAVIAVIYIDLRVRKEALDLELLAGGGTGLATASEGSLPPQPAPPAAG